MVTLDDVRYVVDENLMGLGNGMVPCAEIPRDSALHLSTRCCRRESSTRIGYRSLGIAAGYSSPSTDGCVRGQLRRR